jgi:uncharacterized membrane protein YraQ (UPF0718 family)
MSIMHSAVKRHENAMTGHILMILALAALLLSFLKDREQTRRGVAVGVRSLLGLIPCLLAMVGLIGLVLTLIPTETIVRLFSSQAPGSFFLTALVGSVVTIPAPVAFPLAGSLLKLGATPSALGIFITTLTMVGFVSAPLEIEHFGLRFTLTRQLLSFSLALAIGLVMRILL